MNDQQKYYVRITTILCVGVIALATCIAGHSMYQSQKVAELIKEGVPPIEARCAIQYLSTACPNR